MGIHIPPWDHHPCAVGAEHRVGRILCVCLGVVARRGHDLLGVVAGLVAVGDAGHAPLSSGVGHDLADIAVEGGDGAAPHKGDGLLVGGFGGLGGVAVLQIRHGAPHVYGGHLQTEFVVGLQQGTAPLHEAVTDGAVGGLAEVTTLGMLLMGATCHQHHFGVGEGDSRQGAEVGLFVQVSEDEPLPVLVQKILGEVGVKDQTRACGERLHEELYLGVVAQGLEVAHAYGAGGDPLPIQDTPLVQLAIQPEAVGYEALEQVDLNVAHEPRFDLLSLGVPTEVQGGLLLLQLLELGKDHPGICPGGESDGVGQDRGEEGGACVGFCP